MKAKKNSGARAAAPQPEDSPAAGVPKKWEGVVREPGADRADRYVADIEKILSRSQIKARKAAFYVDGKLCKPSRPLRPGDELAVQWVEEISRVLVPEHIDVDLLFENERVFVVNKAQGMVTHPANGNWRGTLANAILGLEEERRGDTSKIAEGGGGEAGGEPLRGGIVHRLDKDTSGTIIVARDLAARDFLASQFKARSVKKEYYAVTRGIPAERRGQIKSRLTRDPRNRKRFTVSDTIGKLAVTEYRVLKSWKIDRDEGFALVALYPGTGRTHQLRVHLASLGCPILGDPIYGTKSATFPNATLMLHARRLKIALPGTKEIKTFTSPLPERFKRIIYILNRTESEK